jgi:hypothetical protein
LQFFTTKDSKPQLEFACQIQNLQLLSGNPALLIDVCNRPSYIHMYKEFHFRVSTTKLTTNVTVLMNVRLSDLLRVQMTSSGTIRRSTASPMQTREAFYRRTASESNRSIVPIKDDQPVAKKLVISFESSS